VGIARRPGSFIRSVFDNFFALCLSSQKLSLPSSARGTFVQPITPIRIQNLWYFAYLSANSTRFLLLVVWWGLGFLDFVPPGPLSQCLVPSLSGGRFYLMDGKLSAFTRPCSLLLLDPGRVRVALSHFRHLGSWAGGREPSSITLIRCDGGEDSARCFFRFLLVGTVGHPSQLFIQPADAREVHSEQYYHHACRTN